MRRSKDRVTALGFFETVEITHKPGRDDTHVVVHGRGEGEGTGTFQVGFGFSSVENFIFTAQITQNNFLGWGQTVSLAAAALEPAAAASSCRSTTRTSSTPTGSSPSTSTGPRSTSSTSPAQALGGSVGLGYHILDDLIGSVGYTREWVEASPGGTGTGPNAGVINTNTTPLFGRFRTGTQITWRCASTLAWDRRDNRLFPTQGLLPVRLGRVRARLARRQPELRALHALLALLLPAAAGHRCSRPTPPSATSPTSTRTAAAGVRALLPGRHQHHPRLLAELDRADHPGPRLQPARLSGARPSWSAATSSSSLNLELEFPIVPKVGVKGVVFVDAGNAFAVDASFFEDKQHSLPLGLFWSAGFGIRWFSPVGPLRFEWGIPLTRRPIDDPILFEFTIGNSF